ncbi:YopX family protein [Sporolactobacillus shoreicorticis]|uniref:YopX family protein n=1 Tax=Sporolactobacillus shoreicorticis TaxID=1923877 RepID=A0ABW5S5S3_9BACL|nr:YopX family protein [Sporolactobacillus shoreicorticis]MCO7127781.1 YopX family protein [Sporolactobacillus shoreicorticis]
MREIKFRIYDKQDEQMIEWSDLYRYYGIPEDWDMEDLLNGQADDEYSEVMQSTGLKDKNGREIYEGDILYYTVFDRFDHDQQYKGIVKWSDDDAQWFLASIDGSDFQGPDFHPLGWVWRQDDEPEIIGNIYENPNLLKEGETNG